MHQTTIKQFVTSILSGEAPDFAGIQNALNELRDRYRDSDDLLTVEELVALLEANEGDGEMFSMIVDEDDDDHPGYWVGRPDFDGAWCSLVGVMEHYEQCAKVGHDVRPDWYDCWSSLADENA